MSTPPPNDRELGFYYFGLYRVLIRYRRMTILGWCVVALGIASIPLGWESGQRHGIIDLGLSFAAIVAGLALVQQSVASLSSYISVQFPSSILEDGTVSEHEAISEVVQLMKDIDEGGWQEAYAAIGKLKEMETTYSLPPLNR
jgi:hypothetical protein